MRPSAVELFRNAPASGCRVSVELRQAKGGAGSDRVAAAGACLLYILAQHVPVARAGFRSGKAEAVEGRTLDLFECQRLCV